MQVVSCYVNLAGDVRHVVWKDRVTVAEVMVLRQIHGAESVTRIKPVGGANGHQIGVVREKERLVEIYGRRPDGEGRKIVEALFPGFNPRMPKTLKDIGVTAFDDDDSAAAAAAVEPAVLSPAGEGGSPEPLEVSDAQSADPSPSAGDDQGGDPPEPDYRSMPVEEAVELEPGVRPKSGLAVPGLRVS